MKKYADKTENLLKSSKYSLKDILKDNLLKSIVYDKAIENKKQ